MGSPASYPSDDNRNLAQFHIDLNEYADYDLDKIKILLAKFHGEIRYFRHKIYENDVFLEGTKREPGFITKTYEAFERTEKEINDLATSTSKAIKEISTTLKDMADEKTSFWKYWHRGIIMALTFMLIALFAKEFFGIDLPFK